MKLAWISLASSAALAAFAHPHPVQAQTCAPGTFAGSFAGEVTFCQNWSADEQQKFWFLSQGSQAPFLYCRGAALATKSANSCRRGVWV